MKKTILTAIVLLFFRVSSAQKYYPMLNDSIEYYELLWDNESYWTMKSSIIGDTIIHGNKYYKYFRSIMTNKDRYNLGYMREDTSAKKVYFKVNPIFFQGDTSEIVLYDFSLNLGDSIRWSVLKIDYGFYNSKILTLDGYSKVTRVSKRSTNAGERLLITITEPKIRYQDSWLESIGFVFKDVDLKKIELNCFYRNGVKEYESIRAKGNKTCIWEAYDSKINSVSTNNVFQYDKEKQKLIVEGNIEELGEIAVFGMSGRLMLKSIIQAEKTTIDVSSFPEGIYFVSIKTNTGILSQKIVISKE